MFARRNRTFSTLLSLLSALVLLAACGGGGGGTGFSEPGVGPLRIVTTSPADNENQVPTDATIFVAFENDLDPASISPAAIVLESDDGPVSGSVTYDDAQKRLVFTPGEDLPLSTPLRATIPAGLRDMDGNEATNDYVFEFATRDAVFGDALLQEALPAQMRLVGFRVSPDGKGAYVRHEKGATNVLRAHYYDSDQGFGGVFTIHTSPAIREFGSAVETNGRGDLVVAWLEFDGVQDDVYMRRYQRSTGMWLPIDVLENDPQQDAGSLRIAFGNEGDILAVWTESDVDNGTRRFAGRSFVPGSGWSDVRDLGAGEGLILPFSADVGINELREGYFTSSQRTLTNEVAVFVRRWDPVGRFGAATNVTAGLGEYHGRRTAIDATGQITVICSHGNGLTGDLRAAVYAPGLGWQPARLIEERIGEISYADVLVDATGTATILWIFDDDETVNARRLAPAGDLGAVTPLFTSPGGLSNRAELLLTGDGRLMAFWQAILPGTTHMYGSEFDGSVWGPAQRVGRPLESRDHFDAISEPGGGALVLVTIEDNLPVEGYYRMEAYRVRRGLVPVIDPVLEHDPNAVVNSIWIATDAKGRGAIVWNEETPGLNDDDLRAIEIR